MAHLQETTSSVKLGYVLLQLWQFVRLHSYCKTQYTLSFAHTHSYACETGLCQSTGTRITSHCKMFSKGIIPLKHLIRSVWIESFGKMERYEGWSDDGFVQGSGHSEMSLYLLNNFKIKQLNIHYLRSYED